ncbi:MAG: replication initiation factor domain-containing protein [bacterium]|nr:replication initiation factor domain-containing protein [bacterium]
MSTSKIYPRSVTPGIENHSDSSDSLAAGDVPGVYCTIDWLRGTCSEDHLDRLIEFCESRFGSRYRRSTGAKHFDQGFDWSGGVQLSYGHSAAIAMLDVRGEWLASVGFGSRIAALRSMTAFGLKMTRIDLALDFIHQDRELYHKALASCQRDEHCRLRSFEPNPRYGPGLQPTKLVLRLGSRESSACAKIYDKGLEQKAMPPGAWERIECEFKEAKVAEVAQLLIESDEPEQLIPDIVFDTFDFREHNGRSELKRRPRVEWWADIVQDRGIRVRSAVRAKSFQRWRDAFVTSYGRTLLRLSESVDVSVPRLVGFLLAGSRPADRPIPFEGELRAELARSE